MKPNIYKYDGAWFCEPCKYSVSYVVGMGDTPMDAFTDFKSKLQCGGELKQKQTYIVGEDGSPVYILGSHNLHH